MDCQPPRLKKCIKILCSLHILQFDFYFQYTAYGLKTTLIVENCKLEPLPNFTIACSHESVSSHQCGTSKELQPHEKTLNLEESISLDHNLLIRSRLKHNYEG